MRLFFAGMFWGDNDDLQSLGITNKLYSYHNEKRLAETWGSKGLMLDSGAFSAFTTGAIINIDGLIDFIKKINPEFAIQLDVIGDEEATWRNYQYMVNRGILPVPVIHHNASKKHIERVLNETDNLICLGGLVPLSRQKTKLFSWLDYLYTKYPKIQTKKIHCLGIMSKDVLQRYPFYSCDSTSALSIHRYPRPGILDRFRQKTLDRKALSQITINEQLKLEKYITELWTKRGIIWQE